MPDPGEHKSFFTAEEEEALRMPKEPPMPKPSEHLFRGNEEALLRRAVTEVAGEHKPIFAADVLAFIDDTYEMIDQAVLVAENGDYTGTLLIRAERAEALAAWIEAYPSLTKAAKVEVPNP